MNRKERRQAERNAKKLNNEKSHELPIHLLQPWAVPVIHSKLPPEILNTMIEITDDVIADKNSISHGGHLAGQIDTELRVPHEKLNEVGAMNFFLDLCSHFVRVVKSQQYPYDAERIQAEKLFI